jgi:sugar lactone lactonase YvrE
MERPCMSHEQSVLPPESGGSRIRPQARRLALPGMRPSAGWAAVAAAIAVSAVVAGCSASPASTASSASTKDGLTAAQGQEAASASQGINALGISLASGQGAAAVGSPGTAAVTTTVSATALSSLTYTATGTDGGLYKPQGISADNGTVYVSNTGENVVASIANGATTAIAGSLEYSGEKGDGGQATSATLARPAGTAENAKGDIFIADAEDNVVREITPDGVIHRIAGTGTEGSRLAFGSATRSELNQPQAVAVAPNGDLLIADTGNDRVLVVTPSGKIGVVAGDGIAGYKGDGRLGVLAELNQPTGVAVDGKGDVYIADAANNVIRRVDARTGIITTVAGDYAADQANDGEGGDSGDGGPATQAELNDPQGIAIDSTGNLFIADTFNNAIRVVNPNGTIATLWTGQNTPYAVATDPSAPGTVYFADADTSKVEKGTYTDAAATASPSASS